MAKKTPKFDFHTQALLVVAVAGLVFSSGAATLGVTALAYEYQMSLPATTQVASVASTGGSGLTDSQVSAVLNLLAAFNAPQDTITSISAILKDTPASDVDDGNNNESGSFGQIEPFMKEKEMMTARTVVPPQKSDAPRPACPAVARHLMRGAIGDDVAELQKFLTEQGALESDNITGNFGPMTHAALERWQLAQGVIASTSPDSGAGEVGTLTRAAILRLCKPMPQGDSAMGGVGVASSTLPTHVPPTPGWSPSDSTFGQ